NYDKDQLDAQTFKWPRRQDEALSDAETSDAGNEDTGPDPPPAPPLPIPKAPPLPNALPPKGSLPPGQRVRRVAAGDIPSSPPDMPWEGSDHDVSTGTLNVEKWLTRIQDNDQDLIARSKMEYILGTKHPAPIFEFRDLVGVAGDRLEAEMRSLEDAVIRLHRQYALGSQKRSLELNERAPDPQSPATSGNTSKGKANACPRKKCPPGQARIGNAGTCEACPASKMPSQAGDVCEDKCPVGQAKTGPDGKCEMCPPGQAKDLTNGKCNACPNGKKPNPAGDGCDDDDPKKEERERRKQEFEAKKGGSRGFKGGGALGIAAGIKELLQFLPSVAWDYEFNIDVCAITVGTFLGGNCHTSVNCQVDGEKHYDDEWEVCRVGGEQFFTDDRIGEFSVTFTVAEAEKCAEGLCRPIIKVQIFQDWAAPIDAEDEADK
ncbi:MAG: hypothetical protein Q9169_008605, partial [Polycauliona sp. 2 TL-2023]